MLLEAKAYLQNNPGQSFSDSDILEVGNYEFSYVVEPGYKNMFSNSLGITVTIEGPGKSVCEAIADRKISFEKLDVVGWTLGAQPVDYKTPLSEDYYNNCDTDNMQLTLFF